MKYWEINIEREIWETIIKKLWEEGEEEEEERRQKVLLGF